MYYACQRIGQTVDVDLLILSVTLVALLFQTQHPLVSITIPQQKTFVCHLLLVSFFGTLYCVGDFKVEINTEICNDNS